MLYLGVLCYILDRLDGHFKLIHENRQCQQMSMKMFEMYLL